MPLEGHFYTAANISAAIIEADEKMYQDKALSKSPETN